MGTKKEVKQETTIEKVKRLTQVEHSDFKYITTGTIEGSKNSTEYAIATDTGLFFYLFKNEKLQPLDHVLWENVKEIKVDYLALRTNLTLNGQNYRLVNEGKKIFALAQEKSEAKVEKVNRKWHQKILGFRSGTNWKKITAVVIYILLFGFIGSSFFGEEEAANVAIDDNQAEVASQETADAEAKKAAEIERIEEVIAEEKEKEAEKETSEAEQTTLPNYEIVEENLNDAGIYYVTLSTDSRDEEEIEMLIRHSIALSSEKDIEVNAIHVSIKQLGVEVQNIANGKIALTNKGLAQTGLTEIPEVQVEFLLDNIVEVTEILESKSPYTADDVVQAFEENGLSVPEPRDNTNNICTETSCSQLVTTETVSIYQWIDEATAEEMFNDGFGSFQAETFTLRFNEEVNEAGYNDVLTNLVN